MEYIWWVIVLQIVKNKLYTIENDELTDKMFCWLSNVMLMRRLMNQGWMACGGKIAHLNMHSEPDTRATKLQVGYCICLVKWEDTAQLQNTQIHQPTLVQWVTLQETRADKMHAHTSNTPEDEGEVLKVTACYLIGKYDFINLTFKSHIQYTHSTRTYPLLCFGLNSSVVMLLWESPWEHMQHKIWNPLFITWGLWFNLVYLFHNLQCPTQTRQSTWKRCEDDQKNNGSYFPRITRTQNLVPALPVRSAYMGSPDR